MKSNWTTKKMPQVVKWGSGGTPKATIKEYYENGNIPWLIIGDLNDDVVLSSESYITTKGLENSSAKMIPIGTLLVAMYGSIGKLGITGIECCTNQAIAFAKELYGVTTKFMYYQMKYLKPKLVSMGKGGTQKNISQTVLNSLDVIVPPIDEQKRIVAKIEELFSKLDNGVAKLNKIKEQLKIYRQAVLKAAFEGKLTKDKRINKDLHSLYQYIMERNATRFHSEDIELYDLPNGWIWVNIGNLTDRVEYGSSKKSQNTGLVPVLRMGNIQNGVFDWSDLVYSSDSDEINKYLLKENDVLFNRTNSPELVGKSAIYIGRKKAIFAGYLIRINQYKEINAKYLNYYLNSFMAKKYGNMVKTDGVNQSNINGRKLCSYPFPLCTVEEQELVVSEIESRLSVCDKIEQTVNETLQKAESLRQSILKQAFEGELYNEEE